MTERYLGSIITANPVEPSANVENSPASGVWNVHDPLIFGQASDWPDPANPDPSKFVENLFSTFTYTGTGSSQTITNDIDLDGSGGLIWTKRRDSTTGNGPWLNDTERGITKYVTSAANSAETDNSGSISAVTSSGYTMGTFSGWNASGGDYVSWTFRKQPKFFDIVTATADSSGSILINHNLGTTPGFVMVKRTSSTGNWFCYHRSLSSPLDQYLQLNTTGAVASFSGAFSNVTSTTFQSNLGFSTGSEIVFYLFAHNNSDGGFGENGDQDVIKCGVYDGNDGTQDINVGFEPQWLMIKNISNSSNWVILDMMRNFIVDSSADSTTLRPNTTDDESSSSAGRIGPRPNGFGFISEGGNDFNAVGGGYKYSYVAIRRGPKKAPTAGTDVFATFKQTDGDGSGNTVVSATTPPFPFDLLVHKWTGSSREWDVADRLRGRTKFLKTDENGAEATEAGFLSGFDRMVGYKTGSNGTPFYTSVDSVAYFFKRAPKFFDVVAYSGDGTSSRNIKHNLTVAPELIFLKNRTSGGGGAGWIAGVASLGNDEGALHSDGQFNAYNLITTYSTTTFTAANADEQINKSGETYVAYLFATLAGISKVGTYSGTGSDVNVDCGFTSGARFVLVKRTNSSGDWFVWDSTRGIVAGNDPYVLFNTTAAEVTNTDYIDPLSSGFTITSNAGSDLNTSGGTYLFLAIA